MTARPNPSRLVMGEVWDAETSFAASIPLDWAARWNSIECDCREQMAAAQSMIEQEGRA